LSCFAMRCFTAHPIAAGRRIEKHAAALNALARTLAVSAARQAGATFDRCQAARWRQNIEQFSADERAYLQAYVRELFSNAARSDRNEIDSSRRAGGVLMPAAAADQSGSRSVRICLPRRVCERKAPPGVAGGAESIRRCVVCGAQ
jgi:hypothetical protein